MSSTRIMHDGRVDLTGQTVNTLLVQAMVSRRPEPQYSVVCEKCNSTFTATHSRLRSGAARCLAANCGKVQRPRGRDPLAEQRKQISERENQRRADELQASERRMEVEADGWERPMKYAPNPDPHVPMTAREVSTLRQRREELEAERLAAEAPRLEAEAAAAEEREAIGAANNQREEKQRAYWSEWITNDRDPKLVVTDALRDARMSTKDAEEFTAKAAAEFAASPEYAPYKSMGNADVILGYLRRNGVFIADAQTIKAAFHRLLDLGLLTKNPSPAPQPAERQPRRVNLTIAPEPIKPASGPQTYIGRDFATGAERTFTEREVNRMSSLEFQRAFEIVPTVAELFTRMTAER
jgi:hypothetical protein